MLASLPLIAALTALPTQKLQGTAFPLAIHKSTLPNGLTLLRVPFDSPGLVACYTVVRTGSRNEVEAGHTGFAHFFEHMMFKGTKTWPEGTRDALLAKLGFNENAFTSDDITVYHVTGPTLHLAKLLELEADRFQNLEYSEQSFQTEAKAVLGEYHKNAANPFLKIEEALLHTAFTAHTYRHTTLGFYDDIKAMPERYEYSKEFFRRWYRPDNIALLIVGQFDDQALVEAVQKHYGGWGGKAASVTIPVEPPQTAEKSVHVDWPTPTLSRHLHAWHTPAATPRGSDGALQEVLANYLAGPTSPLYKDLVTERQLVQSVMSDYSNHRDPALFGLMATLKDEKHRAAVRQAFDDAVAAVAAGKIDARRLQDVKDHLRYGVAMGLETPDQVALKLAFSFGVIGDAGALDAQLYAMSKITAKQLTTFARTYLTAKNRTVLTFATKPAPGAP